MELNDVQRAAQEQFARQSANYGKGHILAKIDDVKAAATHLHLLSRATVLDVATGGGHTGLYFAELGHDVTLADLAQPMLDRAANSATERGLRITTRQHSAEQLPYPDASFDLVTCRVAAHHFSSPPDFVRETARVLRPGGALLLIDRASDENHAEAEAWMERVEKLRDPSHHLTVSTQEWRRLCDVHGLRICHLSVQPFKQPDLTWYFEAAATSSANRTEVLDLIAKAPDEFLRYFQLGEEDGKIIWYWERLTLIATREAN